MSAAQVCVLHDKRDAPWSDWVTGQLSSAGVQVHHQLTTDPDAFTGERLIVLDSWEARYSYIREHLSALAPTKGIWAGESGRRSDGPLVIRIDGAPPYGTWRHYALFYTWHLDLVGRHEDDARAKLLELVRDRFELSLDASAPPVRSVRFPGLVTVFLSYRRADNTTGLVTRLREALPLHLPRVRHFLDITDPDPEAHVPTRIRSAISNAPVLLVLIGRHWLGRLTEGPDRLRINQKDDFVRMEIAEALENKVPLVLILMAGARIPKKGNLPENIRALLSAENVLELSDTHFDTEVDAIVKAITRIRIRRPAWDPSGTTYSEQTVF